VSADCVVISSAVAGAFIAFLCHRNSQPHFLFYKQNNTICPRQHKGAVIRRFERLTSAIRSGKS